MKNNFKVNLVRFSNLLEIPGRRTSQVFLDLLELMEFDGISELAAEELEEMCLMSLQELAPVKAAELVLKFDFGNILKDGQIKNLANEMLDEKLWEEYADPFLHENFFNVGSLLYKAFPKSFPFPDAVSIEIDVTATNEPSKVCLKNSVNESFISRIIASGMDEDSVLKRLFKDQIEGDLFPEAESLIWIYSQAPIDEDGIKLKIISSGYWLDPLKGSSEFETDAYPDLNKL